MWLGEFGASSEPVSGESDLRGRCTEGRVNATHWQLAQPPSGIRVLSQNTPERQMQGRVDATQLEFCPSVYGSSFKLELSVNVQTGHLKGSA